ncbi:hypothetical protein J4Q44_G00180570 [Coregonus suidteri]|uniref:Uncharacterized protein n=1 Tax=Coregonus suidteri TaxID=861788 RepID=A0AAN8QVH2_9TELE
MFIMSEKPEEFDFRNNKTSEEAFRRLAPALLSCTRALLNFCDITVLECATVSSVLQSENSRLSVLDLGHNNLRDEGVIRLCCGLRNPNCKVETLNLRHNHVGVGGVKAICEVLTCPTSKLQNLDLSCNDLGDPGAKLLAVALHKHCKLQALSVIILHPLRLRCARMSKSLACKTIHVSPALGQYNPDSVEVIMSQNSCVPNDQSHILGTELNLMEMTEVEYTHLQHIIQSHMEAQAAGPEGSGDARFNTTVFTMESPAPQPTTTNCEAEYPAKSPPNTPPDVISSSTDEQQYIFGDLNQGRQVDIKEIKMVLVSDGNVIPGERTPTTCGEVPGSVLAKVRSAVDATQERGLEAYNNGSTQLLSRPNPPARVRLEKRFNCTPCDIPRPIGCAISSSYQFFDNASSLQ